MKARLSLIAILLLAGCQSLFAQSETPRFDLFGGYSHVSNFDIGLNGWIVEADKPLNHWLGLDGAVSGHYGSETLGPAVIILPTVPNTVNSHMYNFNFGPIASYRAEKFDAFAHLLFGASQTNVSATGASQSDTSFSWVLGGGATYNFVPKLGARFQVDLLRTNFFSVGDSHARVSIGLVYHAGKE